MAKKRPEILIYTDGACSGNPGAGGYGIVLLSGHHRKEISKGFEHTTNQRMELMAVIVALESIKRDAIVTIYTDSMYVRQGITTWIKKWVKSNWKTAAKKPVKNQDLWKRLLQVTSKHKINWKWVKGHAGNLENERCDALARMSIKQADLAIDSGYVQDI